MSPSRRSDGGLESGRPRVDRRTVLVVVGGLLAVAASALQLSDGRSSAIDYGVQGYGEDGYGGVEL